MTLTRHKPDGCGREDNGKDNGEDGRSAGKVLPESQCGFRKERGCVDMIFVARQLLRKEGNTTNHCIYFL